MKTPNQHTFLVQGMPKLRVRFNLEGAVSGNFHYSFDDVAVVSIEACDAPIVVTSDEIDQLLAPFYERVGAEPGLLPKLAGIETRRQWPADVSFIEASALAGEKALAAAGVKPERIGMITNTSVCRDRLEPSSAVTAHHRLGLSPLCINFDVSNACLGFLNGMHLAGTMIEAGQIDYALIVDGEGTREIQQNTVDRLLAESSTIDDLFANFASLTLGSGSVAMVIGRHSIMICVSARSKTCVLTPRRCCWRAISWARSVGMSLIRKAGAIWIVTSSIKSHAFTPPLWSKHWASTLAECR